MATGTMTRRAEREAQVDRRSLTAPNGEPADLKIIASTERLASDGGIILTDAWDLSAYQRNPIFLALHDSGGFTGSLNRIVAGRSVWVGVEAGLDPETAGPSGRALAAYVRFAGTEFGAPREPDPR